MTVNILTDDNKRQLTLTDRQITKHRAHLQESILQIIKKDRQPEQMHAVFEEVIQQSGV